MMATERASRRGELPGSCGWGCGLGRMVAAIWGSTVLPLSCPSVLEETDTRVEELLEAKVDELATVQLAVALRSAGSFLHLNLSQNHWRWEGFKAPALGCSAKGCSPQIARSSPAVKEKKICWVYGLESRRRSPQRLRKEL